MLDFDNIDGSTLLKILEQRIFVIFYFKIHIKEVLVFETKHGWHVYIEIEEQLDDMKVLFIQTALGDDFKRACFNYTRVELKIPNWNVLYTENEKYNKELSKKLYKILKKGETQW
jgi:hypothetical protein